MVSEIERLRVYIPKSAEGILRIVADKDGEWVRYEDHIDTIASLRDANKALMADWTEFAELYKASEAKLAKVEAALADERLHFSNYMAVVEPKIDRLSAELAEAQKREEHAIKAIEEALGWHQTTHIHMALRSFLASKEASQ